MMSSRQAIAHEAPSAHLLMMKVSLYSKVNNFQCERSTLMIAILKQEIWVGLGLTLNILIEFN